MYSHLLDQNGKFKVDLSRSRGERNNNPGNLMKTSIAWIGKVEPERNSDGHFEQFYEMKYGVRAMVKDLMNDMKEGKNTLTALITEYAPKNENNTTAYIKTASKMTGFSERQVISPTEDNMRKLAQAIAYVENGKNVIDNVTFQEAWKLV